MGRSLSAAGFGALYFVALSFMACVTDDTDTSVVVESEAELAELIHGDAACGDGRLDLHRGHAPIQSTLEDLLEMSHDEMHERMENQGQNLAAVADDIGLGADELEASLVDHFSPSIDTLLDDGVITEETAERYREELVTAIDFRVNWDGDESPPDFCTADT